MSRYVHLLAAFSLFPSSPLLAADGDDPKPLEIGAAAPDFDLPGADGKSHTLKEQAGAKVLAIVFTCNHCPTAQAYEGRLKQLVTDYKDRGVAIVAISPNAPEAVRLNELGYTDLSDSLDEMKIRARDAAFNFPYLYDGETQELSRAYGPAATPHVFLFDAARKLRYRGRIDDSEDEAGVKSRDLGTAIDALLAGKPVPVETTKTFGCSIKWARKKEEVKRLSVKPKPEEIRLDAIGAADLRQLVTGKQEKPGKLRLVNVWATWCGPCVAELPELVVMTKMYGHRAFELVTVSADKPADREKALELLRKEEATSRNYIFESTDRDKLMEAVDKEWSGALPHTLLVTPDGKVVYRRTGEIDPLEVRRAIVRNLKEDRR